MCSGELTKLVYEFVIRRNKRKMESGSVIGRRIIFKGMIQIVLIQ